MTGHSLEATEEEIIEEIIEEIELLDPKERFEMIKKKFFEVETFLNDPDPEVDGKETPGLERRASIILPTREQLELSINELMRR